MATVPMKKRMFKNAGLTGRRVASNSDRILNRGSGRFELKEALEGESRGTAEDEDRMAEITIVNRIDFIFQSVSGSQAAACVQFDTED